MWTTKKGIAAVVAVALGATAAVPATAAPVVKPASTAQVKADGDVTDISARRYRRGNNAAAAAMFGAVAGTIATIAINEQRRKRERDYWRYRSGYAYAQPYGYGGYYAPNYYNRYGYGTPYHGPRGPWAPPCARGFCY